MRTLFLLRGAPGSGKSTFITQRGLERYTLGFDQFRHLWSGPHPAYDHETIRLRKNYATEAINAMKTAAENRMRAGETLFIDNKNDSHRAVSEWSALAKKYRYTVVTIDIQGDITDTELLQRNETREPFKRIPAQDVLTSAHAVRRMRASGNPSSITPDQLDHHLISKTVNLNKFERVFVIGDVQGCGTALRNFLNNEKADTTKDAFIFAGDLFDRGVENTLVMQTILDLHKSGARIHIAEGNHDTHLFDFHLGVLDVATSHRFPDTQATLQQLKDAELLNGISLLISLTRPFLSIDFGDTHLWITHGGVLDAGEKTTHGYRVGLLPASYFIYGESLSQKVYSDIGDYEFDVDQAWEQQGKPGVLQCHGHRNISQRPPTEDATIFNLESEVEFEGGALSAMVFTREGHRYVRTTNPVTIPKVQRQQHKSLQEALRAHKGIAETPVPALGIFGYNFTRQTFKTGGWGALTRIARGLFLNSEGAIVQRGYDKSFGLGERAESFPNKVLNNFAGSEIICEEKVNGFLGQVSWIEGAPRFFTKRGPTHYAKIFEGLVTEFLDEHNAHAAFNDFLHKHPVTLTFEVVDTTNDPHVTENGPSRVVFLHAICHEEVLRIDEKLTREFVRDHVPFNAPKAVTYPVGTDLTEVFAQAALGKGEGYIFRTPSYSYSVKVKTDLYMQWKRARPVVQACALDKVGDLTAILSQRRIDPSIIAFLKSVNLEHYRYASALTGSGIHIPRLVEDYLQYVEKQHVS